MLTLRYESGLKREKKRDRRVGSKEKILTPWIEEGIALWKSHSFPSMQNYSLETIWSYAFLNPVICR
uniref:Uncharacterized protein n=1 Tax=Magnetococcus massalia (strain MO-1) TaxID=451514 RepID=A0A1S7LFL2_MAGMO|nr:protein of unknown function [Candidatus Magnetococcus massalia]